VLEANPRLTSAEVKQILQQTATNMPGMEPWEAGAGYVNAYAAVDRAFQSRPYGSTLNLTRTFNASALETATRSSFTVPAGFSKLVARVDAWGLLGETGNTINLVLIAPDGTEHSSGVSLLFPLYTERTVSVTAPMPGTWQVELRGRFWGGKIGTAYGEAFAPVTTLRVEHF